MRRGQGASTAEADAQRIALRHIASGNPGGPALGHYRDIPLHRSSGQRSFKLQGANFGEPIGKGPNVRKLVRKAIGKEGIEPGHIRVQGGAVMSDAMAEGDRESGRRRALRRLRG